MTHCGRPDCRGGHKWLNAYVIDTFNCGGHRDLTPEEIAEANERNLTRTANYVQLENPA